MLSPDDLYLFNEGNYTRLYDTFGAHPATEDGVAGTHFAVWAPSAEYVSVIGDFNGWDKGRHPLRPNGTSGVWRGFVAGVGKGDRYKYHVGSRYHVYRVDKADPVGFCHQAPPW